MLLSPILSFVISLRFYKSGVSHFFMIVFAFYFGSRIALGWDLSYHYLDMRDLYFGRPFANIIADPRIWILGGDYFHVAFKFLMSRIKANPALFSGTMCAIYTGLFLSFFVEFRRFYKGYMPVLAGMLLITMVCVVPYNWFYGMRYYPGFFLFAGCYMRYLNTGKLYHLLLSLSCMLFHFALIVMPLAVLLNWLLSKMWKWVRVALLGASMFVATLNWDFVPTLLRWFPNLPLKMSVTTTYIRKNVIDSMRDYRAHGNIFYLYRDKLLLVFGMMALGYLWYKRCEFRKQYVVLFTLFLTLFTISNFGYADLTFSERTLKVGVVFLYAFLFITVYDNYKLFTRYRLPIMFILLIPLIYSILTQAVEQREYLFHIDLLLGNFFNDWHGGLTSQSGVIYHKYMN